MAGIVVEGLVKSFGRATILRGISLQVEAGETFGLIGPNGAGKTTFFGCLLGLLTPNRGSVLIDGVSPDSLSVRRQIGYVPERQTFDAWMTGGQFLAYHHGLAGRPRADREREVGDAYDRVALDGAAFHRRMTTYSRGMLQRIGLAQALIGEPRYLFLDEPTSGMDPNGALAVRRILQGLKARGTTIILNSHQLDQLERVCDRVAFIKDGQVGTIQRLDESVDATRTVEVRFISQAGDAERLVGVTVEGATLASSTAHTARYTIKSDQACAALVRRLVEGGLSVVEVASVEGKLERLFTEPS